MPFLHDEPPFPPESTEAEDFTFARACCFEVSWGAADLVGFMRPRERWCRAVLLFAVNEDSTRFSKVAVSLY